MQQETGQEVNKRSDTFAQHLVNVFTPNEIQSPIVPEDHSVPGELLKFFSPGEIKATIAKMNPHKARSSILLQPES